MNPLSSPPAIRFAKYEGLGNDFIVVRGGAGIDAGSAASMCDRHTGVGADGVLVVSPRPGGGYRMDVWNADGSRPEMCGNGLRCVALALVDAGDVAPGRRFEIDTDAGPHACEVADTGGHEVTVAMAIPSLEPRDLPYLGDAPLRDGALPDVADPLRFTAVSMGNPHLVTFDGIADERRLALAPKLEHHGRFPKAVNVGFARATAPDRIALSVWERGVGWTRACGTGACAAAVAAVETGRSPRGAPIEVLLPGGPLRITVGAVGEPVSMTGPARHVYDGELSSRR